MKEQLQEIMTKQEAYEKATLLNLPDSNGTRMDIIFSAMEIYSTQFHYPKSPTGEVKDNTVEDGKRIYGIIHETIMQARIKIKKLPLHTGLYNSIDDIVADLVEDIYNNLPLQFPSLPVEENNLVLYDAINGDFVEIESIKAAEEYIKDNFVEGNQIHPDVSNLVIYKKIADVNDNGKIVVTIYVLDQNY